MIGLGRRALAAALALTIAGTLLAGTPGTAAADRYGLPIASASSGQCLDVSGWATNDGATVIQWPCNGGANQKWDLTDWIEAAPWVVFVSNRHSGKCLDVTALANGARATQRGCWANSSTQKWSPVYRGSARGWHYYTFENIDDMCLDVPGGTTTRGAVIQVWTCNGSTAQLWRIPA